MMERSITSCGAGTWTTLADAGINGVLLFGSIGGVLQA